MYLKEIGINTRNWVGSAQVRDYWRVLVNAALILRVPLAMEWGCLGEDGRTILEYTLKNRYQYEKLGWFYSG